MPKRSRHTIRDIAISGDIAIVPLTRGMEAVIDAASAHVVSGYNWTAMVNSNTTYAVRWERRKPILMHRSISGFPSGVEVDHINHNGLDNRLCNIRPASRGDNTANSIRSNKHGYRGISFHSQSGLWNARVKREGKYNSLGYFKSPEDAALAYNYAAVEVHGEFSTLNIA